ncbi:SapC family protein [Gilvimarinus agarilyticus]|uniref:SapC family protein n=1 Tax=Gilvimarinus sp. 2_MG-2023 TaxID=3062666 RepID=UPI001C0A3EE6|nr:SapC family protein [Gilvimarinus sp. 2_MG-2023]MBU2886393.1 SapC family protein [Gilvimarinus agarilyticus]MDO6571072.1 SapC family protein [Gilvimarinus sp. 2_MG-2023]
MANLVPLDKSQHSDIKIITERGAKYGENIHLAPIIATELRSLVLDYPCALMKDEQTGRFGLYSLLGFNSGENLFLQGNQWRASYIPLHMRRQPFVSVPNQEDQNRGQLLIDMDSTRISTDSGESLFNSDGSTTEYMQHIQQLLGSLMSGMQASHTFIENLSEQALLEPIKFDVAFANGDKQTYQGMYTINEDKLANLTGKNLQLFHERGYLNAAHYLLASLGHIRKLVDWKNTLEASQ